MHAPCYFFLSLFYALSCVAADTQKSSMVAEWIVLAHNLRRGNSGYFHTLPLDIQTNIFSRIHPAPSLDDWQSNNMLCVKSLTVPHCIMNFDINSHHLVFVASQIPCEGASYGIHSLDFKTNTLSQHCQGSKIVSDAICFGAIPVVYLTGGETIVITKKGKNKGFIAYVANVNKKEFKNYDGVMKECVSRDYVEALTAVNKTTDEYALVMKGSPENSLRMQLYKGTKSLCNTYCINDVDLDFENQRMGLCKKFLNFYIYNGEKKNLIMLFKGDPGYRGDRVHGVESEPFFSPDGSTFCAKHKKGILRYNLETKEQSITTIDENENPFLLRGVGHSTYLAEITEITDTQGNATRSYELRKFDSEESVPLTELKNALTLHRLPSSDDYRYVTVVPDEEKCSSIIQIFVPKTIVLFQHYCMLQAALAAQENRNKKDRVLFTAPQQTTLVEETKKGYPVFDYLMAKAASKEQKGYA